MTLSSLGGLLLSGGRDNIIRVWDMEALVCRRTLPGHRDDVMCIAGLGLQPPPRTPSGHLQPTDHDAQVIAGPCLAAIGTVLVPSVHICISDTSSSNMSA